MELAKQGATILSRLVALMHEGFLVRFLPGLAKSILCILTMIMRSKSFYKARGRVHDDHQHVFAAVARTETTMTWHSNHPYHLKFDPDMATP